MTRRVVITGLGPVASTGIGVEAFAGALRAGTSGISQVRSFDTTGFRTHRAGEVHDFDASDHLHRLDPAGWGRSSQFAAAAARLAFTDAGADRAVTDPARLGVCMGTTSGESQVMEELTARWLAGGYPATPTGLARQVPAGRVAEAAALELGAAGPAVTVSTACSASNYALGYAFDAIGAGDVDFMVVGGADSVCRFAHAGFYRLGALAEDHCAPFDRDRTGVLTAEGGVGLYLESLDSARARDARIYCEVLGYGLTCDAQHPTAPDAASVARCMRLAHDDAGIKAEEVDFICAHGTATPANDAAEYTAVRDVFGTAPPPMSSIKSMLGHTMGAASGFSAVAGALAIHSGFLSPTINHHVTDPGMPGLDVVPNRARPAQPRVVQVNGFAFGGNNAISILGAAR
ncbi:beta-ketoacyl-[acyl-carrier-protein] synthase family protein [Actinoplanes sp. NEAU-A12]|uniref:Beta-ketoacyl-[acyl-carrier-protein] synthase family protein n=1 Tax=Actinoplanes sandaracinus TaxID=3045177 RepID=A0ABT6WHQ4_9ACTN|nr:beta-ketoacyl-[acyl-carrier-protein] synthase family protein [Actinoplanes sandaracinus]MDI6099266.1 beta-ketoacyl-[acyl-carrier-protein] synthase family protein [Actinoplanes sandaracinus]